MGDHNIDLAQLEDDLFRLVTLLGHWGPPVSLKTYFRVDHFNGGRSKAQPLSETLPSLGQPSKREPVYQSIDNLIFKASSFTP
jgi:hypothetical protein